MSFHIDRTAPTMEADYERSSYEDVAAIMGGATEICSWTEDNDSETWNLTRAGQFVRRTGVDADRYYVVPVDEALEYLEDYADDETVRRLRDAGAFTSATSPRP